MATSHIRHETARYGFESLKGKVAGKEGVLPKGASYVNGMRARGTLAYAQVYDTPVPLPVSGSAEPAWQLETLWSAGKWITDTGGRNREGAEAAVRNFPGMFRIVERTVSGAYEPVTVTVRPSKPDTYKPFVKGGKGKLQPR